MSLPTGWTLTTLSELVTLQTGPFGSSLHQADYVEGGTPIVNPMHIRKGRIQPSAEHAVSEQTADRLSDFRLQCGDVVIGRRGEMGRCAVVTLRENGWLCGTGSMVIRCCPALQPEFLQRLLTTQESVDFLGQESVGSTMANLNQKILLGLPVRLPPMPEQQRIVEALEALEPGLDDAVAELVKAKRKLALYRQALLKSAVEGALTADWRLSNAEVSQPAVHGVAPGWLPTGWGWMPVSALPELSMANGRSVPTATTGAKVLRLTAIREGGVDLTQFKVGAWSSDEAAPFAVREGDLLVVRGNGSLLLVGRAGVVGKVTQDIAYPDTLIRLRWAHDFILPAWITLVWDSALVRDHMERKARTSAGIYKISQPDIASAFVPVPSPLEQMEIVRRMQESAVNMAAVGASLAAVERSCSAQRQNILRAAFSGQLVPHDPNDEPASLMLERIRAGKSSAAPAKTKSRGRVKAATA